MKISEIILPTLDNIVSLNPNDIYQVLTIYNYLQEPHDNGPLFCELHFYQRAAQPDMSKLQSTVID